MKAIMMTALLDKLNDLVASDEWPQLLDVSSSENNVRLLLDISDSISWFAGHFPEQAVLPGVVQLHWATQLAQTILREEHELEWAFCAANNVKFKTMILPGQQVTLSLSFKLDKTQVAFAYANDNDVFSSGSLVFNS